ncbi:MAG: Tripartite ATP-independent periplasmic transporter [Syntrophaceae bacterium PtaU1.Bin231]|nr:MAG: Tripartite ATP-independent periplasmic transporter [Syntrophaceae bacterium PtaU1.Bin231]HOG17915.1 TRAP transporter small permease subunit [Syntrophales bacterium]
MKTVIAMMKVIDAINEKIAKITSYCLILLILSLVYEVVARYAFNAPTVWSSDATYFLCSIALIFAMAYTWQTGGHVSVDMILVKFPVRVQAFLNVFFMVTMFFWCWFMIIGAMVPHVIESWRILERSSIGYFPPIYPYKTWILIGTLMMILQGFNVFIKELYRLIQGKELTVS